MRRSKPNASSNAEITFGNQESEHLHAASYFAFAGGSHERTIREIKVSKGGISLGKPLDNLHGVLTGVPNLIEGDDPKKVRVK